MRPRYLLDSNVLSEPLRPQPAARVMQRLRRHRAVLATAAPVWHELLFGCLRLPSGSRRSAIQAYLDEVVRGTIPILPYDEEAAARHAAERERLARRGRTPPYADGQIAAIAQTNRLVLVTANVADFTAFEDLDVENWSS